MNSPVKTLPGLLTTIFFAGGLVVRAATNALAPAPATAPAAAPGDPAPVAVSPVVPAVPPAATPAAAPPPAVRAGPAAGALLPGAAAAPTNRARAFPSRINTNAAANVIPFTPAGLGTPTSTNRAAVTATPVPLIPGAGTAPAGGAAAVAGTPLPAAGVVPAVAGGAAAAGGGRTRRNRIRTSCSRPG